MCKKISNWFHRVSKGWVVLLSLIIFLLFTALVLPAQSSKADLYARSAGSPDLSFFYTPNDLYKIAGAYGVTGRADYITARFTFDLIWPLVYTVFLVAGIGRLCQKVFPPNSKWQQLNLVPILGALFDYLENISASLVMGRFPGRTPVVDTLAPVFTMVKWILVGGSFMLLMVGAGIAGWRWIVAGRRTKLKSASLDKPSNDQSAR